MAKNIVLFFGSFNPIHNAHLIIANYVIEHYGFDSLIFIPSPQNPFKNEKSLINIEDRIAMLKEAVKGHPKMKVSSVEKYLESPSYTINTLNKLREIPSLKKAKFTILMGLDNFVSLHKWKDYQEIITNNSILVYPRGNQPFSDTWEVYRDALTKLTLVKKPYVVGSPFSFLGKKKNNTTIKFIFNAPLFDFSATFIRQEVKKGHSITFYTPKCVEEYIISKKLYKS